MVDTIPDQTPDETATERPGRSGRGHIGLIVLASVAAGLVLGLVLDVLLIGGSSETVITGLALLSLAAGCLMLRELSRRRTDQPQDWALIAALCFGVTGLLLLIVRPDGHLVRLLGWVWPILLIVLVVWMFRESRRSLHSWSRRAVLYPAFGVLTLVALGGAIETVIEATTNNDPPPGGRTYLVAGHRLYLRCSGTGRRLSSCSTGLGSAPRAGPGCKAMSGARLESVSSIVRARDGAARASADRTPIELSAMRMAFSRPPMFQGPTSSPATRWAAPTPSPTRWTIRGTWLVSRLLDSSTPYQFDLSWYPTFYSVARRAVRTVAAAGADGIVRAYIGMTGSQLPAEAASQRANFRIVSARAERRPRRVRRATNGHSTRRRLLRVSMGNRCLCSRPTSGSNRDG